MGVVLLGSLTFLWLRRGAGREERVEPAADDPALADARSQERA